MVNVDLRPIFLFPSLKLPIKCIYLNQCLNFEGPNLEVAMADFNMRYIPELIAWFVFVCFKHHYPQLCVTLCLPNCIKITFSTPASQLFYKFPLRLKHSVLQGRFLGSGVNDSDSFRKFPKLTRLTGPLPARVSNKSRESLRQAQQQRRL